MTFSFFERLKTFAVCFARMPMRSSWELLMKHPIGVAGLLNLDSIFKQSAIEYISFLCLKLRTQSAEVDIGFIHDF